MFSKPSLLTKFRTNLKLVSFSAATSSFHNPHSLIYSSGTIVILCFFLNTYLVIAIVCKVLPLLEVNLESTNNHFLSQARTLLWISNFWNGFNSLIKAHCTLAAGIYGKLAILLALKSPWTLK